MPDPFDQIVIVLVNTSHPGNIGATARAMKNMGLRHLRLVDPVDYPSGVAVGRAAGALDVLEAAQVFPTLEAAIADCGLVIGTSARSRSIPVELVMPDVCADISVTAARQNRVALVFGREANGLSNEELLLCNYHVQIPASEAYASLNLAAAVMVICYEVRLRILADAGVAPPEQAQYWDRDLTSAAEMELFYAHLERVLVRIEFHDPDNPRQLLQRLRRLFGRIQVDTMEMNILRGILSHVEYHLDHPRPAEPGKDV